MLQVDVVLLCVGARKFLVILAVSKMAPVHFEALESSETVLYARKLSSDIPKY